MTESMIVEAIRSAGLGETNAMAGAGATAAAPDPAAVAQFQAAMAASEPAPVAEVPFADAVAKTWTRAHENNQEIIHRIRTLGEMSAQGSLTSAELVELQYEVANLAFQQEVVAKVADKASTAIQTLIKNQ